MLDLLRNEVFRVFHHLGMLGGRATIEHLVIGPTRVFAIETKNWGGRIGVKGGRLFVNDHDRSWVIDQVYHEALAVQIALADEMNADSLTVTPVLAIHGTGVPHFERTAAGVALVPGKGLVAHLRVRPARLDPELVQRLARLAHRALHAPMPLEDPSD